MVITTCTCQFNYWPLLLLVSFRQVLLYSLCAIFSGLIKSTTCLENKYINCRCIKIQNSLPTSHILYPEACYYIRNK